MSDHRNCPRCKHEVINGSCACAGNSAPEAEIIKSTDSPLDPWMGILSRYDAHGNYHGGSGGHGNGPMGH